MKSKAMLKTQQIVRERQEWARSVLSDTKRLSTAQKNILALAIKAAGWEKEIRWSAYTEQYYTQEGLVWNPIDYDGDGARLEEKLGLNVYWHQDYVQVGKKWSSFCDHPNKQEARRVACVKAAAFIAEEMEKHQ